MQENINSRIAQIIESKGISINAFAKKYELTQSYLSEIIKGKKTPSESFLLLFADKTKLNKTWLLTGEGEPFLKTEPKQNNQPPQVQSNVDMINVSLLSGTMVKLPYFRQGVPCGGCKMIIEEPPEFIDVPIEMARRADFAIRANGDSMLYEGIIDGSLLLCSKQSNLNYNGEIIIVELLDNGITCKKGYYSWDTQEYTLKAANPVYDDIVTSADNLRIIGKLVDVWTKK